MSPVPATFATIALVAALAGCASYHRLPLPQGPDLVRGLDALDHSLPAPAQTRRIDVAKPLAIDAIGLLAILNNPGLRSERGELAGARAGLLQASLLPNPAAGFDYGALLGGPGTSNSIAASLSEDIVAIVTYGARVKAARAHFGQVDADLLWREWQVAQKARQLALDIYWQDRSIALLHNEFSLLAGELRQVRAAIAAGNLNLSALAPLLTAEAGAERALTTLQLAQLKNWQALDGLLGLVPSIRFAIARPSFAPLPPNVADFAAALSRHRPDLVALRFGYRSAEENLRAAILAQFPAFKFGGFYSYDTTKVISAGPSFSFALPVFDRNQGRIAAGRATRLLLREQYRSRLDSAVAAVHALVAQLGQLRVDLAEARKAAAAAAELATAARRAYNQGNLDQRSLTDYETTALERKLLVVSFRRQLGEDRIFLAVELGLGLPKMRIVPLDRMSRP